MQPEQQVGAAVALTVLVLALVASLIGRRISGRFVAGPGMVEAEEGMNGDGGTLFLDSDDLGAEFGERATLVQFSSAFCQPCRATRRVLADVRAMVDGVAHVEIDAESHLGLVRRAGVLRTPTVLVLDATGRVVRRASGQPRRADVIAALGHAIGPR